MTSNTIVKYSFKGVMVRSSKVIKTAFYLFVNFIFGMTILVLLL